MKTGAPSAEQPNDAGRKARQVVDVRDIRLELVDETGGHGVDRGIGVGLGEVSSPTERVVDPRNAGATTRVRRQACREFWPAGILVTRDHEDVVAEAASSVLAWTLA